MDTPRINAIWSPLTILPASMVKPTFLADANEDTIQFAAYRANKPKVGKAGSTACPRTGYTKALRCIRYLAYVDVE